MPKEKKHLQHLKSNVVTEGKPKLPAADALMLGEIAVNYAKGVETISLKNTNNEIVTFSSDDYYTEQKLGSGFTNTTVTDKLNELTESIIGLENVPNFDVATQYKENDYVLYGGVVYRFVKNHKGVWNANDVEDADVYSELNKIISNDYEFVTIYLKTNSEQVLSSVVVEVTVEGEENVRSLYTNEEGVCSTYIRRGLACTVSVANVAGFDTPSPITLRASLATRTVNFVYQEQTVITKEQVRVSFSYNGTNLGVASEMYVTINGDRSTINILNNIANFEVDFGVQYTVSFQAVNGYLTPADKTFTAERRGTRTIPVGYYSSIEGVSWLMSDGSIRGGNSFFEVTEQDRIDGEIFGLLIQTSTVSGYNFVVPIDELTRETPWTGRYLSSNIQVTGLGYFTSHASALTDLDGYYNCEVISDFAKTNNISSTMCNLTYNLKGGYDKFSEEKNYSKNRYVMYEGEIYQFTKDHSAGAWDVNEVNLIYSEFDPQSGYSVDDKVIHDEKVYVFVENHTTGTDWNASEVNEVFGYLWSDGNFRTAFVPAYGQIYALYLVRTIVGKVIETIFNEHMISLDSGNWWSSTQYGASNGVKLYNGGFNGHAKIGTLNVLPVLAY